MSKLPRLERFNEGEFVRDVKRLGGDALKQNPAFNAGVPDRLCWIPSSIGIIWFWAEWKRFGLELRPVQTVYHKQLRDKGHIVYVFDSNSDAREVLVMLSA